MASKLASGSERLCGVSVPLDRQCQAFSDAICSFASKLKLEVLERRKDVGVASLNEYNEHVIYGLELASAMLISAMDKETMSMSREYGEGSLG